MASTATRTSTRREASRTASAKRREETSSNDPTGVITELHLGTQRFDARLHVAVVETPLGNLAVRLRRRRLIVLRFKRAAVPVGHFDALWIALQRILINGCFERVDGFVVEPGLEERATEHDGCVHL